MPAKTRVQAQEALLVIDMQNDFVLPGAVLCVKDGMACVSHVVAAVAAARLHNVPVIWVIREHLPSGADVELFRQKLYTEGPGATVQGTEGAQLVDGLEVQSGEVVISKKRFSAFFATHLDLLLRRLDTQRVVICGVQTPNCIRGTAWDAVSLDYPQVTVLSDATASATREVQEANLFDMRKVGVDTPTVAEWAAQLQAAE